MKHFGYLLALTTLFTACHSSKEASVSETSVVNEASTEAVSVPEHPFVMARRPVVIYRTKADYDQLVPVTLNATRKGLSNYPAPSDVSAQSVPVQLGNGYLYDRRGIGVNVAFTRYTYAEYAQLKQVPSQETLFESIVEKYPLTAMWYCTKAYYALESKQGKAQTAEAQITLLKQIIVSGFEGCQPLLEVEVDE